METRLSESSLQPLREFVLGMTQLMDRNSDEKEVLSTGRELMSRLIERDDWLPDLFAQADSRYYRQYLLYADPYERFSVVSFVWGPGQGTPVHNHTVWGLIGVLRGAEESLSYERDAQGRLLPSGQPQRLDRGSVEAVSPTIGDIHEVRNAYDDRDSVSIHVYGGNIGTISRQVFEPDTGVEKPFVSGYTLDVVPNIWK